MALRPLEGFGAFPENRIASVLFFLLKLPLLFGILEFLLLS